MKKIDLIVLIIFLLSSNICYSIVDKIEISNKSLFINLSKDSQYNSFTKQPIDTNIIHIGDYKLNIKDIPTCKKYRLDNKAMIDFKFIQSADQNNQLRKRGVNYSPREQYVIVSKEKEKIALITVLSSTDNSKVLTNLELFKKNGELIYTLQEENYVPSSCVFFIKSNKILANWGGTIENMGFKLFIYDELGSKIDSIVNIGRYKIAENSPHLFYMRNYDYSIKTNDKKTIAYYNVESGETWKKEIKNNNTVRLIKETPDGRNILCQGDTDLILINIHGNIIWSLPRSEKHMGSFFLSSKGNYVLRFSGTEDKIYLYNTLNNKLLLEKNLPKNNKYYCRKAAFIDEKVFALSSIQKNNKVRFDFYDLYGKLIYSQESNFNSCKYFSLIRTNDKKRIIDSDGKPYDIDFQEIDVYFQTINKQGEL
jgi:hypothetical protein